MVRVPLPAVNDAISFCVISSRLLSTDLIAPNVNPDARFCSAAPTPSLLDGLEAAVMMPDSSATPKTGAMILRTPEAAAWAPLTMPCLTGSFMRVISGTAPTLDCCPPPDGSGAAICGRMAYGRATVVEAPPTEVAGPRAPLAPGSGAVRGRA